MSLHFTPHVSVVHVFLSFSCVLPKGGQEGVVWVGLYRTIASLSCMPEGGESMSVGLYTYNHITPAHIPHRAAHPTPTIVVHLKGGEGHKDTLHSDGQQRKIISLFVHSCMCACTNACMYTYVCVCLCVHTFRTEHPTQSPACPAPGSRWMY